MTRTPRRHAGTAALLGLLAALTPMAARGADPAVTGLLPPGCGGTLTIGRVDVITEDVFDLRDPAENHRLYRWADRLHRTTGESVVRSLLLFESGDPWSPARLEESERSLRARRAFSEATVETMACHDGVADVRVVTHDTWTLGGGVSFGRAGGENATRIDLSDSNFLGSGKEVLLRYSHDVDRSGYEARYVDPAVLGTHNQLSLSYLDNDDGGGYELRAGRPFYRLDARWAAEGDLLRDQRTDHLYHRGQIVDGFAHRQDLAEISGGWSTGLSRHGVRRFRLGFTRERHTFAAIDDAIPLDAAGEGGALAAPSLPTQGELPESRTLAYPWIGVELLQDDFLELEDLDQIGRVEDRYLGTRLEARLGWSAPAFGGDRSRAIGRFEWSSAWQPRERVLLEVGADGSGRYGEGLEDALLGAHATLHWRDFGDQLLYVSLSGDTATNLDRDHQLLLGGDTGLRGYPLRFQDGERRVLATVEQRVFTDWYPWHLFRVGAAAFVDVGQAWGGDGGAPSDGLDRLLADIGVGLRLGLSRSGRGNVLHFDVALPLVHDGSFGHLQWLVSTQRSF